MLGKHVETEDDWQHISTMFLLHLSCHVVSDCIGTHSCQIVCIRKSIQTHCHVLEFSECLFQTLFSEPADI